MVMAQEPHFLKLEIETTNLNIKTENSEIESLFGYGSYLQTRVLTTTISHRQKPNYKLSSFTQVLTLSSLISLCALHLFLFLILVN